MIDDDPGVSVGDLQRRAVEQATEVIGRFLQVFDDRAGMDDPLGVASDAAPADVGFTQMRAEVGRAVDLYLDLFRRTFDSYASMMETSMRERGVAVTGGRGRRDELVLEDGGDGRATASLYVHNFSGEAASGLVLRSTDLTAFDGSVIPAARVTLEPAVVAGLDDGATARVAVSVELDGAAPGTFVGHVLAAGMVLPVRLHVAGA